MGKITEKEIREIRSLILDTFSNKDVVYLEGSDINVLDIGGGVVIFTINKYIPITIVTKNIDIIKNKLIKDYDVSFKSSDIKSTTIKVALKKTKKSITVGSYVKVVNEKGLTLSQKTFLKTKEVHRVDSITVGGTRMYLEGSSLPFNTSNFEATEKPTLLLPPKSHVSDDTPPHITKFFNDYKSKKNSNVEEEEEEEEEYDDGDDVGFNELGSDYRMIRDEDEIKAGDYVRIINPDNLPTDELIDFAKSKEFFEVEEIVNDDYLKLKGSPDDSLLFYNRFEKISGDEAKEITKKENIERFKKVHPANPISRTLVRLVGQTNRGELKWDVARKTDIIETYSATKKISETKYITIYFFVNNESFEKSINIHYYTNGKYIKTILQVKDTKGLGGVLNAIKKSLK